MSTSERDFNLPVNGLRGLCILLVFIFHIENSKFLPDTPDSYVRHFLSTFKYGVEIFFMISGYVIVNSIHRKPDLKSFFIDRALRIYPTWVPLHFITFIGAPLINEAFRDASASALVWVGYFFSALLLLPPVIPLPIYHPAAWSLSYEWCFYLVTGGLTFCLRRSLPKVLCIGVTALICLFLFNLFPRGMFFLSGVYAALHEDELKQHAKLLAFPGVALIAFLLTWSGTGAEPAQISVHMTEWLTDNRIFYAIAALVAGTYLFCGVVIGQGWFSRFLSLPIMQFYGKISYSFYLWSTLIFFPTKLIARRFLEPVIGTYSALVIFVISAFIISTVISWLNWYYIEKRFTGMLKRKLGRG